MTSSSHTAFVFVPGGFCPGAYFHKVTDKLKSLGFPAVALDLPSTGKRVGTPAGLYDDAAHVDKAITQFVEQGKNVVLVGNSYGGFVAIQAGKGLTKPDRQAGGHSDGGLIGVVFIAGLIAPLGITCAELVSKAVPVSTQSAQEYIEPLDAKFAGSVLFSDMEEQDQLTYGAMQKPQSSLAFAQKLTHLSYEEVPTTLILPTKDKVLSPQLQLENADAAIQRGLNIRKIMLDGGHCSMLSKPDEIITVLLEAAGAR